MVDSSSFHVCLVPLVVVSNPSCSSCLSVCAKEGIEVKMKVGSLDYQGNEWSWESRLCQKSKFETIEITCWHLTTESIYNYQLAGSLLLWFSCIPGSWDWVWTHVSPQVTVAYTHHQHSCPLPKRSSSVVRTCYCDAWMPCVHELLSEIQKLWLLYLIRPRSRSGVEFTQAILTGGLEYGY